MVDQLNRAQPDELQRLAAQIQSANIMSQSLLFSLERQYLDVPLTDATFLQPGAGSQASSDAPYFLRLEQVGSGASALHQPLTALQTALTACHNPGRHSLIFLIASDGRESQIYLGVRGSGPRAYAGEFANYLGSFVEGNWPGTRLRHCDQNDPHFARYVMQPLQQQWKCGAALTGIPSLKPGEQPGYPQSLDRLLRGLRGVPFLYMVVAEPQPQEAINDLIYRCRELIGRVHTLTKTTLSETLTSGLTITEQEAANWNHARTHGSSTTVSHTRQTGLHLGLGVLAGAIATVFPPAGLFSSLALATGVLVTPNLSFSTQQGTARSHSESDSFGGSRSHASAVSSSTAQALGRETINAHAQAAEAHLQAYIDRFEQARALGCWNVGVYFLAAQHHVAQQGGTQLRALLSGQQSMFEPLRVHDLERVWHRGARLALSDFEQPGLMLVAPDTAHDHQTAQRLQHPLGPAYNGLTTPLNTEELSLLVNLPRRETPGIRLTTTADFSLNAPAATPSDLMLGSLLEGGEPTALPYRLSTQTLARHALVTGITGSGKSTTCRRLLRELHDAHIPFLVIEPAKDEYLAWAMQINAALPEDSPDRIAIYAPGMDQWQGRTLPHKLHLNPFDVVWLSPSSRPAVLSHLDRLKSILVAAFPMQDVLPILLENALFHAYSTPYPWLGAALPAFDTPRPTLSQLVNQIAPLVQSKGYDKPVTANLTAALSGRIQSLRQGWKQQLFDQPRSTPWTDLFDRPVVINLSQLGDEGDKALTMAVLLQFLYEYRQAQHDQANGAAERPLRHLAVVEEAHRLLSRTSASAPDQANPQAKVAEMFANLLAEIRAYGQGILVVDQVPAKLIPDAVKNTNLKIVHRLVAADDRDAMANCMALTPEQAAMINRLRPGQAIVYGDLDDMAAWLHVHA